MPGMILGPGTRPASGLSIKVNGPQFITNQGTPIQLQGVSISGPEYEPVQQNVIFNGIFSPNQSFFNQMRAWGVNLIRWPINAWQWMADIAPTPAVLAVYGASTPGNPATGLVDYAHTSANTTLPTTCTGATYRNTLLAAIDLAAANNIYSIVDLHWSDPWVMPGYSSTQFGGTNTLNNTGNAQIKQPTLVDAQFWGDMASRCANRPYVMFELANECQPDHSGGAWGWGTVTGGVVANDWIAGGPYNYFGLLGNESTLRTSTSIGMQGCVNAIRNTGATNVIVVPGVNFEQEISGFNTLTGQVWVGTQNAFLSHQLTDPLNNFCLAFHAYTGSGQANTPNLKDFQIGFSTPTTGTANWNFPIICTEFGPSSGDTTALTMIAAGQSLPGNVSVTATIPIPGSSGSTAVPYPTQAESTYTDPRGFSIDHAFHDPRILTVAGATGSTVYTDISNTTFTSVSGSGTTTVSGAINSNVSQNDSLGYTLQTLNWHLARASTDGHGAGTQLGPRSLHLVPWNWNISAGPSLITNYTSPYSTPTNYGLVIERYFLTKVC